MALTTAVTRSEPARRRAPRTIGVAPRAGLQVVPRARHAARIVAMISALVFVAMLGALALQVRVARQQVELDRVNRQIEAATTTYDQLRRERAELRSPGHLAAEAQRREMTRSVKPVFMVIEPDARAAAEMAMGRTDTGVGDATVGALDQFGEVKRALGVEP